MVLFIAFVNEFPSLLLLKSINRPVILNMFVLCKLLAGGLLDS
jgi:hypothetical protein